jgi:dipicolinate synthase subunit A
LNIWIPQRTAALDHAANELARQHCAIVHTPTCAVTHVLLPVPCKLHPETLDTLLSPLPSDVTVLGGFLDEAVADRRRINLLSDASYQAENAMITTYCALQLGADALPIIWAGCPVLILGWGRIGKCLSNLLHRLGANVTVAARKDADLALCGALGYRAMTFLEAESHVSSFRVVFNTVPVPILRCPSDSNCVFIELASKPGMEGSGIIDGRGLPGKMAPESAGALIARTVIRLCGRKEQTL